MNSIISLFTKHRHSPSSVASRSFIMTMTIIAAITGPSWTFAASGAHGGERYQNLFAYELGPRTALVVAVDEGGGLTA